MVVLVGSLDFKVLAMGGLVLVAMVYGVASYLLYSETQQMFASARDEARLSQRAWITVAGVALAEPLEPKRPIRAVVTIKNAGQTPGFRMAVSPRLTIRDTDPPFVNRMMQPDAGVTDIGPGETASVSVALDEAWPRALADLSSPAAGNRRLYAIVEVAYSDVFQHAGTTRVCSVYQPKDKAFVPCGAGNELR